MQDCFECCSLYQVLIVKQLRIIYNLYMSFSLHIQTDDATLVYYRYSDKESKYLDLESDMGELIRDYNLTFDKYIYTYH